MFTIVWQTSATVWQTLATLWLASAISRGYDLEELFDPFCNLKRRVKLKVGGGNPRDVFERLIRDSPEASGLIASKFHHRSTSWNLNVGEAEDMQFKEDRGLEIFSVDGLNLEHLLARVGLPARIYNRSCNLGDLTKAGSEFSLLRNTKWFGGPEGWGEAYQGE